MPEEFPTHTQKLMANMEEVVRLVDIHQEMTGTARGRRHNVAILNKSGLVLMVSCWEAFVEDLALHAFDWLLTHAKTPGVFPSRVLTLASKRLRDAEDTRKIWELAGDGWRRVLSQHKVTVLKQSIGKLNTPRSRQVDTLFSDLLGFKRLSSM